MKHILLLIILTFNLTTYAQWTKGKGNGYFKLGGWTLTADTHYTDTGKKDPNATRGTTIFSLYGEYGIHDKIDLIGYFPFFVRTFQNKQVSSISKNTLQEGETVDAFGDIDFGIKYSLLKTNKLALSISVLGGLPTGDDKGGSDNSYQSGDGEFNQLVSLDLGLPLKIKNLNGFFQTGIGYNIRNKGFSDDYRFYIKSGLNTLNKKLWIIGFVNILKSTFNGNLNATNSAGSVFANNIEYISPGIDLAYLITSKLGITYNYDTAVYGRVIFAAPSHSVGFFLDLN